MVRCVLTANLLASRLPADNVACKQDFGFPVSGSRNVFYNNAAATGAVYADNAFGRVLYHHSDVLDTATAAEENKVARQYLIQRNTIALTGLCGRTGRNLQVKFFENVAGKPGAIESGFRRDASVAVAQTQKILGVAGDVEAQLHGFCIFGAVAWPATYALERRAGNKNEQ